VAEIRGMRGKGTLLNFIAELFANAMDLLDDPDVSMEQLQEAYGKWQLAVLPYGEKNIDVPINDCAS